MGQLGVNEEQNLQKTTTRNIRFPNQMIEQINIALEQKRVRGISAWVIEARRRRLTSEKRAYTSIKRMKNEHPASFSEQDDIVIHLITRVLQ